MAWVKEEWDSLVDRLDVSFHLVIYVPVLCVTRSYLSTFFLDAVTGEMFLK